MQYEILESRPSVVGLACVLVSVQNVICLCKNNKELYQSISKIFCDCVKSSIKEDYDDELKDAQEALWQMACYGMKLEPLSIV